MKHKTSLILGLTLILGASLVGLTGAVGAQRSEPQGDVGPLAALGSGFTYQGRLNDGGSPANDLYDFEFKLYDDASGGWVIGIGDDAQWTNVGVGDDADIGMLDNQQLTLNIFNYAGSE